MKPYIATIVMLALIGFATFGIVAIQDYGKVQYQAGYDARSSEQSDAKEQADKQARNLQEQQRKKINELQNNLQKSLEHSERLAAQIRVTEFDCPSLGDEFLSVFNEGTDLSANPIQP